ncbi:hypothetical protein IKB17_06400 [bacterium]|nr:hypothetical protein [bacterium]
MNEKLKDIIISILGEDVKINESTSLSKDLSFTSIHFVQLIVEIEAEFEFEFDDDDMDLAKLDCIGDLNNIIYKHIG